MGEDLVEAAFAGDVAEVDRLLDGGADIDQQGRVWNPLHAAIENENIECVRRLIERGADIERLASGGFSPLAHAVDIAIDGTIQTGGLPGDEPIEIVTLLLNAGADPASGLMSAKRYRSAKLVALLTDACHRRNGMD